MTKLKKMSLKCDHSNVYCYKSNITIQVAEFFNVLKILVILDRLFEKIVAYIVTLASTLASTSELQV